MSYTQGCLLWQPKSYAEMGAFVPFTTPELTGARARWGIRGFELTVPNLAGKPGVYILDHKELSRNGAASLHDRHLSVRLAGLTAVNPTLVRQNARVIAQQGLAGRQAINHVNVMIGTETRASSAMQLALLRQLVAPTGAIDEAGLDGAIRAAVQALAVLARQDASVIRSAIAAIAELFAPLGLPGNTRATVPELLAAIGSTVAALAGYGWRPDGRASMSAALIVSAATDTVQLATCALAAAHDRLADLPALVLDFARNAKAVEAELGRIFWLLDGWTQICLIWALAPPNRTSAAVCEMALMAPSIPAEAGAWYGVPVREADRQGMRAEALGFSDWRSGSLALELLARNEAMRGLAA
jgi:hypothetical protein